MKNSLFALLWAIVTLPVYAQKPLPVSLQNNKSIIPAKILHSLELAGFVSGKQIPGTDAMKVQSRSNPLRLDSVKVFNGYDLDPNGDSTATNLTTYEYPQAWEKIETVYAIENGERLPLNRSIISSDVLGRVVEVYAEAWKPEKGDFFPDSRAVSYPHGTDLELIDSIYVYGFDTLNNTWITLFFTINQYDDQDRLLESVSSFDYFGQPLLFKDVYSYNANGDNHLVESYAIFDGTEFLSSKRELTYQNHLPVEVIAFVTDGISGFSAQSRITYTYTDQQLEEQVNGYEWDLESNDWFQVNGTTYAYDNAQRLISKLVVLYNQDGSEEQDLYTYDYEEDNQLHSEAHGYGDGAGGFLLFDRTFYYYSDETLAGREPQSAPLQVMPNPTAGVIRLGLEEQALVQIYNLKGELIMSGSFQPNATISLETLPSGAYIISAQDAHTRYNSRLVKE
ncbi:MAG TPA: T9SS type A sorting domain-containing protein [Saprospiraceae bacterium]|nr:T9SS type A sorting domain-containing protein [Saprospiraceae bacterium]